MLGSLRTMQERLERVHAQLFDRSRPAVSRIDVLAGHVHGHAIGLGEQLFDGGGLEVDGAGRECLVDGVGLRLDHGADGPVDRPATLFGDRGDVGDGVVHDLLAKIVGDVLAVAGDGRGRTDVGGRCHGRDIAQPGS